MTEAANAGLCDDQLAASEFWRDQAFLFRDASPDSWNVMISEPVAAEKTDPKAKTAHCAIVKPNKDGVFISLVGNESGKVRTG